MKSSSPNTITSTVALTVMCYLSKVYRWANYIFNLNCKTTESQGIDEYVTSSQTCALSGKLQRNTFGIKHWTKKPHPKNTV